MKREEITIMPKILDGKQLSQIMQAEIAAQVAGFVARKGIKPGLAAVLVGGDPASLVYVRNKRKACTHVGMDSWLHELPAETTQAQLLELVGQLNSDPRVHGILVQLPLPSHIKESAIVRAVAPMKDIDGFSPENLGLLIAGQPRYVPCTPLGIQQLLVRNQVPIEGRHVVMVGRSNIVGKPLAIMLMQKAAGANATVTVCHSHSRDLTSLTRQADILIVAIGKARFLTADMVKPGVAVIDVGMNRLAEGKLVGDVDFTSVAPMASAITPVPGGVGPMTITMLLHNTLRAAELLTA
jgi:methylenetetrahydrofolate dehydrogenase (NADP+) / methenyltetrahydrofolate cyclohydrolase